MGRELPRVKAALRPQAFGSPQLAGVDLAALVDVAEAAIDYLALDGVMREQGGTKPGRGTQTSVLLAYMNLKAKAEAMR